MRLTSLLGLAALGASAVRAAADAADWAADAARAADGVIPLTAARYDELLGGDDNGEREYGVTVLLTAMPAQFKCAPCHEFDPVFRAVAASWKRVPADQRDKHFFASLDFADGPEVFQRLGLQSAPTVNFHPPNAGPRQALAAKGVQNYDLNRAGLGVGNLHMWTKSTTPTQFELYKPMSPLPFIIAPLVLAFVAFTVWQLRSILVPVVTSRIVWGVGCTVFILVFTTGHMWVKIKNAPYVQVTQGGQVTWLAGGYSNQLGLEGQIMAALYGTCALCVVVLSVFIPAQSSPLKQRLGALLWVGMLVAVFSIIIRIFRMKNGGYPFQLL